MLDLKIAVFATLFIILFDGVTSLRDVRLVVTPPTVIRGGTASLACERDMQDDPLYSVKWYRGNFEFYRYVPNGIPQSRVFIIHGINVNTQKSNGSQVVLRNMEINLAGNFTCEVTADAPSFQTKIAVKFVDVVALPSADPVLKADMDSYAPGEILQANCTSAPAKPAANLTIYINDEPHRSSETTLHTSDSGLQWATVHVEQRVTSELFPLGRLRVTCLASIYDVYKASAKLDFFTPDADPRPERIMLNKSPMKRFQSWMLLLFLLFLPAVLGQDYGIFGDVFDGTMYDDEHSEAAGMTLVGG